MNKTLEVWNALQPVLSEMKESIGVFKLNTVDKRSIIIYISISKWIKTPKNISQLLTVVKQKVILLPY